MKIARKKALSSKASFAALVLVGFNLVMHYVHCPIWVSVITSIALIWRGLHEFYNIPLPNKLLRNLIYLAAFVLLFSIQRTIFGIEAGLNSLVLAAGLKLLEAEGYNDLMNIFMICFLLLMGKLLYSQTFLMTIVLFVDVIAIVGFMYKLHAVNYKNVSFARSLGPSLRLLMWGAPIMAFLFVFFPRIQTRFIPNPIKKSTIGFSNSLEPGLISELAISDQPAFRVRFSGSTLPSPAGMYWRGSILAKSKGMSWYKDPVLELMARRFMQNDRRNLIQQTIIIEPTFNDWLFALDYPLTLTFQDFQLQRLLQRSAGGTFSLERPLFKQAIYKVESSSGVNSGELTDRDRKAYLQIDKTADPKVKKLVQSWLDSTNDLEKIPEVATDFFRKGGFTYTLQPGALETNTISEFIFEKKRGFCEHYASAFASLMRLAGIPSRVIVGFQGGRYNPYDEMYTVTSKDAHAWTEVWSDKNQNWVRHDPTSAVAPERMQLGGQEYFRLDQDAQNSGQSIQELANQSRNAFFRTLMQIRLIGDALTSRWDLFLLNYDFDFQKRILEKWGFDNVKPGELFAAVIIVVTLFGLIIIFKNQFQMLDKDPLRHIMLKFKKFAKSKGVEYRVGEGFISFFDRAASALPNEREAIEDFAVAFMRTRYAGRWQNDELDSKVKELTSKLTVVTRPSKKAA